MKMLDVSRVRKLLRMAVAVMVLALPVLSGTGHAAPFAAYVMDARTGKMLYSDNADTRLYPASLTKMLTLYIAFQAIERGEISLDSMVTVSKNAADEAPSRLGLKAGQKIKLRYLIRAAAVKSANDCATAIGEAIGGSEPAFAKRMNQTARQLGMKNSTFKNANGLTREGHMSTAHDLTILGRHLFYDFPQYYNIFSRRTADAGIAEVANTNRKFLDAYKGADGIKTGYTVPAGFSLTASAERNGVRIIATVLGGTSTAQRNAKMAELLDLGFRKAPRNARVDPPETPEYVVPADPVPAAAEAPLIAEAPAEPQPVAVVQAQPDGSLKTSLRPRAKPQGGVTPDLVASIQQGVAGALAEAAVAEAVEAAPDGTEAVAVVADEPAAGSSPRAEAVVVAVAAPRKRPVVFADVAPEAETAPVAPEVVTRISTSGGRHWGINVGRFTTRGAAERALLKTQLTESATLNDGLRKVVGSGGGYDANFLGLTQDQADLACRRLQARAVQCFTMGP